MNRPANGSYGPALSILPIHSQRAESRPMHMQQTYKRSARSRYSISMQAADDVTGSDKRREPLADGGGHP